EKESALKKFRKIIEKWGIKMPKVEPYVLNFGLGDFYKIGLIEYWITNNEKEGYCGKFLFLFENQTCPEHYHPIKHETFFVVKGKVEMRVNGEKKILKEGDVLEMNRKTKHEFKAIDGPALILEVSTPCLSKDSVFSNKDIGII
ncbi:MAG: cupin domain-containing protein, partial [Candidatus Aenigmarchaeota archaeon]|nr:cupin domain-containing protein [Candidatus Aenigmarchaeota archaeon]